MEVVAVYLVILVAAFYFLIVRPQRRQATARRALLAQIEPGDEVVTTGGLFGTVAKIDDEVAYLEIAEGLAVKVARGAIAARVNQPGTGPLGAADAPSPDEAG
jgi:preprotein translocase subunit YajC